jgi:predicted HTH transcriptional regulator
MELGPEELRERLAAGESSRLEFKRGLPRPGKVARTLAAFANTRGGLLLIGVDDRGRVLGAADPRAVAAEIREIAERLVEPSLHPTCTVHEFTEGAVVVAAVGLSDHRPHQVRREDGESEVPVRLGSSTRAAHGPALEALRLRAGAGSRGSLEPFERQVLEWVEAQGDGGTTAAGRATPQAFAAARNVGLARARRAFVKLERAGLLLGDGVGARRTYARP